LNNLFKLNLQFFGDQSGTADAADAAAADTSNTDTSSSSGDTGSTGDTSSSDTSAGGSSSGVDNSANERAYLSNLAQGQDGNAQWAQAQLSSMGYDPGTGTTGTTASQGGSLIDGMLSAIQNPTSQTTWNTPSGQQFQTPVYDGKSITTMSNLASSLGINYTKDPSTGALSVSGKTVNPVGYDQAGNPIVQVRQVLNAMGVPDQNINYDSKSGNVTYTAPQQSREQPQQRNPFQIPQTQPYQMQMPYIGQQPQMGQYVNNTPFQAPDLSAYYNNLMPVQQQFNPDWNTYYNQAHQQFDPTTNQSIQQLMSKMNTDITTSDEKMNTRGIFNSGLAQANEDLIRGDSSNAVAKVLATSQGNIAKVAQQLYKDSQTQWYQGNTVALQNNKIMLDQAMNQEKQAYTQWLGGQNLNLNQYKAALTAWDNAANMGLKQAQMSMDNSHFYDNLNQQAAHDNQTNAMDMYKQNNLSAYQQGTLQQGQTKIDQQNLLNAGYVKMPDGSLVMSEKATMDQKNYAMNMAKTLGYITNPDGSITQTEQARHDMSQDVLNQQKLTETVRHDKQLESIDFSKVAIEQGKLDEQVNNNVTKAKEFATTMKNNQLKEQVNALTKQMQDSNGNVNKLNSQKSNIMTQMATVQDANTKQFYQTQLDNLNQQIAAEMANLQNAQNGINQRLQLDSNDPSSQEANQNLGK
jgi:hypothetical protein